MVELWLRCGGAVTRLITVNEGIYRQILFVSSNAWDALAVKWFSFDVIWVNRLIEEIGEAPNYEGSSLSNVVFTIL